MNIEIEETTSLKNSFDFKLKLHGKADNNYALVRVSGWRLVTMQAGAGLCIKIDFNGLFKKIHFYLA